VATSYDVGRVARVAAAAVSREVNGQDHARGEARARLPAVAGELGRHPGKAAHVLPQRHKEVIGLLYTECSARRPAAEDAKVIYEDELLRGVNHIASELDWSVLVTFWTGEAGQDFRRLAAISDKVDGVLVSSGSFPPRLLERLARRVPVTAIAGDPGETEVDVVTADNRSGSFAIVTHLVEEHGRRRIYHVDGPSDAPDATQRRIGLQQALRDHPAARLVGTTTGSFYADSGLAAGERILAEFRDDLPDAVVAANDQMAIGVLRSLTAGGIRVPEQVAVVGFDDIYHGARCEPPLTTVHQSMRLLGERACVQLLERIATPGLPPRVELLPTQLVLRRSCGCPPGAPSAVPSNTGSLWPQTLVGDWQ
jgi:LacI family transcriptional regulator, galactose operon repressor